MSELNETLQETGDVTEQETPETAQEENGTEQGETPTTPVSTSIINLVIESVLALIDELGLFATITRGALGITNSLCCEVAPSTPETVYLDKNTYTPLTLAINGKHDDLQVLSDALNNIMDSLTRRTTYPTGNGWQIVDIANGNLPRVIGREDNNSWLMACDLVIKYYRKEENSNG